MLSENDCSTDHPVIGLSGDKVDLKAKLGADKDPGIGPPRNCSRSISRGFQGENDMFMEDE